MDWKLEVHRRSIHVQNGAGLALLFPVLEKDGDTASRDAWALAKVENGFILRPGNEFFHYFRQQPDGRYQLIAASWRNRGFIQFFHENGRLVRVLDTAGRAILLNRDREERSHRSWCHPPPAQCSRSPAMSIRRTEISSPWSMLMGTSGYVYDDDHWLVRQHFPTGLVTHYRYDRQGRCTEKMTIDPNKVERKEEKSSVPDEERCCALCSGDKELFGHVEHELFVLVPVRIEVRAEVDASLLAKLARDKCALGLPLDRQRRELARIGLDVPDKTMQSYWAYTADLLEPVADAQLATVLAAPIVGTDDSHLKTLDKSRKNGTFRGHIWCFVGTDGTVAGPESVAYGYTKSWEATEISDWFSAINGFELWHAYPQQVPRGSPRQGSAGRDSSQALRRLLRD